MARKARLLHAGVGIITIHLFASLCGQALGQTSLSSQVVTLDGAAQLDTGLSLVLSTGTLRTSGSQYAPNGAQLQYSGQAATIYQPMVQSLNVSSLSLFNATAVRAFSPGQDAGFEWQAFKKPSSLGEGTTFASTQRTYQAMANFGSQPVGFAEVNTSSEPAAGGMDYAGSAASSAMVVTGLPPTSCLDLSTGCSSVMELIPPSPVVRSRRSSAMKTTRKAAMSRGMWGNNSTAKPRPSNGTSGNSHTGKATAGKAATAPRSF